MTHELQTAHPPVEWLSYPPEIEALLRQANELDRQTLDLELAANREGAAAREWMLEGNEDGSRRLRKPARFRVAANELSNHRYRMTNLRLQAVEAAEAAPVPAGCWEFIHRHIRHVARTAHENCAECRQSAHDLAEWNLTTQHGAMRPIRGGNSFHWVEVMRFGWDRSIDLIP